jgi:hypothetical protein
LILVLVLIVAARFALGIFTFAGRPGITVSVAVPISIAVTGLVIALASAVVITPPSRSLLRSSSAEFFFREGGGRRLFGLGWCRFSFHRCRSCGATRG